MESPSSSRLRVIPETDDRRRHQRVEPEGAQVEAVLSDKVVVHDIDNLSEGGALIVGHLEGQGGPIVELRLLLPGLAPFPLPARVLRHITRSGDELTAVMFLTRSGVLAHWISELVVQALRAAFPETD